MGGVSPAWGLDPEEGVVLDDALVYEVGEESPQGDEATRHRRPAAPALEHLPDVTPGQRPLSPGSRGEFGRLPEGRTTFPAGGSRFFPRIARRLAEEGEKIGHVRPVGAHRARGEPALVAEGVQKTRTPELEISPHVSRLRG